jgi:hypothetical protein
MKIVVVFSDLFFGAGRNQTQSPARDNHRTIAGHLACLLCKKYCAGPFYAGCGHDFNPLATLVANSLTPGRDVAGCP